MIKYLKTAIWTSLAIVSLVAAFLTFRHTFSYKMPAFYNFVKVSKNVNPIVQIFSNAPDQTASSTLSSTTTPIKLKSKPKPKALSYGDAVNKYTNSRIQFNSLCQAIPGQVVFANGTTVMLDNRSDSPQKIIITGQTYIVAAYNYDLVTLKQKFIPITLHVGCNRNLNSVEITVE